MSKFFSNPIVGRLIGALGAGATTYLTSHDWKSAAVTAASLAVYGAAHSTTTATAGDQPQS